MEHGADEEGGGGFSIRSCHRYDRNCQEPRGQFDFTDDGNLLLPCLGQRLDKRRNARAEDNQIRVKKALFSVAPHLEFNVEIPEVWELPLEIPSVPGIGSHNGGTAIGQKSRHRHPGSGQPNDQDPDTPQVHGLVWPSFSRGTCHFRKGNH